ncbi:MAG: PDDEXK nuclease domain-containing protein [Chitinispirillales bacterium]|jgi:predicted nuclease of restriction endonuclease-like (RecB) superfamily|nr:PDDEXK nuclease domain-containing protein [Chitinispirillales bacterium]
MPKKLQKANKKSSKKLLILIDETKMFSRIVEIIENRKRRAMSRANCEVVFMYWEIGRYINSALSDSKEAANGKHIIATLSQQLVAKYGNSFEYTKLTRMLKFAELFTDADELATLSQDLSWSHFIELLPLKSDETRRYYAQEAATRHLGIRELRRQIARKAYERREIANSQLTETSNVPFNMFKDPYILDALGLKDNYLEADLEKALLTELEAFIIEVGHGFTFAERQKRMTMGDDDYTLDLLFYHRILKRLVAVELKVGRFKPEYMGQMRFYLKWLNRYERKDGENAPIGLILCTEAKRSQIELMELDKDGIAVAQYWTELPPKKVFEKKISEILNETRERLERRKFLGTGVVHKKIDYFYESKDDDID